MKIRLGAFHHESLDLNGDLGNLLVLSVRLNSFGHDCEVVELNGANFERELAKGLDLVFLGHGSKAAWDAISNRDAHFESAVLAAIDHKVEFLAVATGFEKLVELGAVKMPVQEIERRSEFAKYDWNGMELVGYVNSDKDLPTFFADGSIFATLLHGPLLAKNAALADLIIKKLLQKRGSASSLSSNSRLDQIDEFAKSARAVAESMIE